MALQAVRLTIGDPAFFALLRVWVAEHRYGSVTTADFTAAAAAHSGVDLADLFRRWLHQPKLPALPPAR